MIGSPCYMYLIYLYLFSVYKTIAMEWRFPGRQTLITAAKTYTIITIASLLRQKTEMYA